MSALRRPDAPVSDARAESAPGADLRADRAPGADLRADRAPGADLRADRAPGAVGFADAMSLARRAVALYTELRVDAVANCEMVEGVWRVSVDVIEAPARMGDNDLLAAYDVTLSAEGEVTRFTRTGRYHRNDAARAGR